MAVIANNERNLAKWRGEMDPVVDDNGTTIWINKKFKRFYEHTLRRLLRFDFASHWLL
jgi:hypothetical protein